MRVCRLASQQNGPMSIAGSSHERRQVQPAQRIGVMLADDSPPAPQGSVVACGTTKSDNRQHNVDEKPGSLVPDVVDGKSGTCPPRI